MPLDDLGELFGLKLTDEDVETVGGLMAKVLNKVPIAGSVVHYAGLELVAERGTGRRNKIGTVIAALAPTPGGRGPTPRRPRVDAATRIATDERAGSPTARAS